MLGEGVNEFIELLGEYGFLLLWPFSVPKSSWNILNIPLIRFKISSLGNIPAAFSSREQVSHWDNGVVNANAALLKHIAEVITQPRIFEHIRGARVAHIPLHTSVTVGK